MRNDNAVFWYEFKRPNIEAFNLVDDLRFLTTWTNSQEKFSKYLQRVVFSVAGYDLDIRGLSQIPAVRRFFRELNNQWPYFFNFTFPHVDSYGWYFHIQYLEPTNIIDGEAVRGYLSVESLQKFYNDWFGNANQKVEELRVSENLYTSRQIEMVNSFNDYLAHNNF